MVTINQMRRGLEQYIEEEILPHLTTAKAFGIGVYVELLMNQIESNIKQYLDMPAVKLLNVVDEKGNVDLDRLSDVAMKRMNDRIQIDIPLAGRFTFSKDDISRLADLIRNA